MRNMPWVMNSLALPSGGGLDVVRMVVMV